MQKFLRSFISLSLCFLLILSQTGCSALMLWSQRITVIASESDAEIYINGELAGTGSVTKRVPRNQNVSLMARKKGYRTSISNISTTMSFTGTLDLLAGCIILVPLIGLLFPGASSLTRTNVTLALDKE